MYGRLINAGVNNSCGFVTLHVRTVRVKYETDDELSIICDHTMMEGSKGHVFTLFFNLNI